MTLTVAEYVSAGLELTPDERAEAVRLLQAADDESQGTFSAAWLAELRRRVDEMTSGKAGLVDADESYKAMSAKLAKKHYVAASA